MRKNGNLPIAFKRISVQLKEYTVSHFGNYKKYDKSRKFLLKKGGEQI